MDLNLLKVHAMVALDTCFGKASDGETPPGSYFCQVISHLTEVKEKCMEIIAPGESCAVPKAAKYRRALCPWQQ